MGVSKWVDWLDGSSSCSSPYSPKTPVPLLLDSIKIDAKTMVIFLFPVI